MPDPVPPPPSPSLIPSSSTNLSLIGGSLATVLTYLASLKGITFPAGIEAAIAALATALFGYLPRSGRR